MAKAPGQAKKPARQYDPPLYRAWLSNQWVILSWFLCHASSLLPPPGDWFTRQHYPLLFTEVPRSIILGSSLLGVLRSVGHNGTFEGIGGL